MVVSGVKPDRLAYLVVLDIIARFGETKIDGSVSDNDEGWSYAK